MTAVAELDPSSSSSSHDSPCACRALSPQQLLSSVVGGADVGHDSRGRHHHGSQHRHGLPIIIAGCGSPRPRLQQSVVQPRTGQSIAMGSRSNCLHRSQSTTSTVAASPNTGYSSTATDCNFGSCQLQHHPLLVPASAMPGRNIHATPSQLQPIVVVALVLAGTSTSCHWFWCRRCPVVTSPHATTLPSHTAAPHSRRPTSRIPLAAPARRSAAPNSNDCNTSVEGIDGSEWGLAVMEDEEKFQPWRKRDGNVLKWSRRGSGRLIRGGRGKQVCAIVWDLGLLHY